MMKQASRFVKANQPALAHVFLLSALTFLAYSNVISAPFLFDDEHFIVRNQYIRDFSRLKDIFLGNVTQGAGLKDNFYRPLGTLMWLLLNKAFGLKPAVFHLANIFLHIGCGLMIYLLLFGMLAGRQNGAALPGPRAAGAAFCGAAFFLLHPLQTEAVSYCSGAGDLLSLFFLLAALFFYSLLIAHAAVPRLKGSGKEIACFFAFCLCAALSILAKERAAMIIGLLPVFEVSFLAPDRGAGASTAGDIPRPWSRLVLWRSAAYLFIGILVAGWFYLRLRNGPFQFYKAPNIYSENMSVRIYTFLQAFWVYARLLGIPYPLHMERALPVLTSLFSPGALAGLVLLLAGLFAALVSFARKRYFFFAYFWFLLALMPTSGLIPVNAMIMEHWLYFSLLGAAVFMAGLAAHRPGIKIALFPLLLAAGIMTYSHNRVWTNPLLFFGHILRYNPDSVAANNNLAMALADGGQPDRAIYYYQKAILLDDSYPQPHHNLARIFLGRNELDKALSEYRRALEIDPDFVCTHNELSQIFYALGRGREAQYHARRVGEILRR